MRLYAVKHFYDARLGMVSVDDDVLSVVSRVKEMYGDRVTIELDPVTGWYHFVGHSEDGTDYLIFSVESLDSEDVILRLVRSDTHSRGYEDPYLAAEREQDKLQADQRQRDSERIQEEGLRVIHALKKDGAAPRMPHTVAIPKGLPDA